jgi:hypothetical protein
MQARRIVLKTTYTVVGGTEEEAQKACCMVAAGITQSQEELLGPWLLDNVAVEPNISQIVKCETTDSCSDGLKSIAKNILGVEVSCE